MDNGNDVIKFLWGKYGEPLYSYFFLKRTLRNAENIRHRHMQQFYILLKKTTKHGNGG